MVKKSSKVIFPIYSKITLIFSGVLFLLYGAISSLYKSGVLLYFGRFSSIEITKPFLWLAIFSAIGSVFVFIYKNVKYKIPVTILLIATLFLSFLYMMLTLVFSADYRYYEFTSDDKKHSIVVRECSFLLAGGGSIYEKTSEHTMKFLGSYSTDDGFRPIQMQRYYFVWNENDFEFYYDWGGDDGGGYRVEKIEYVKD